MKYLSANCVSNAYMNFQGSMTNKSWGFLAILKQVSGIVNPGTTYEIDCNSLSTFLEETFCVSETKKKYNANNSEWFVIFSNQWYEFFQSQGTNTPNVFDVIIWAYRRQGFEHELSSKELLSKFASDFNISQELLNEAFSLNEKFIEYVDTPYSERELRQLLASRGVAMNDNNLTAIKTTVKASPGELTRGPFIQPLYAALDTVDYLLIGQSNFVNLYGIVKEDKVKNDSLDLNTILREKSIRSFVYDVFRELEKFDKLKAFENVVETTKAQFYNDGDIIAFDSKEPEAHLTNVFLYASTIGDRSYYFKEAFDFNGKNVYLNDNWDADSKDGGRRKLKDLASFIDICYGEHYRLTVVDGMYELQRIDRKKENFNQYLTAIRTKPFLLLAGISGTGKSRIVRELAFKSCPKYLQDKDGTTPGNYCMIEVKPNWHDSTELLGYYSNLSKGYQFKKFVKFLIKAKMFPKVPFFVCLDEMNLAPVEQYFAEILSILETRKVVTGEDGNRSVKTGAIIDSEYFKNLGKIGGFAQNFTDRDIYMKLHDIDTESIIADEVGKRTDLTTEGLTLPDNVIIIGTVNMDDTTHQFSRKVIDRAMTIEMNGGKLKNMFGGSNNLTYLEEEEQKKWQAAFKQEYVSADEVLSAHPNEADQIIELLPEKLDAINAALKGTPFEVSYRVLNELTIMVGVMLDDTPDEELEKIVDKALDRILLMKILPRIEGDSDMFNLKTAQTVGSVTCHNRLEWLRELAPNINYSEEEGKDHQQTAKEKIEEMIERLENQEFTRFWP